MAKPRKPKNEDPKPENSAPAVHHQKLCLSIDMDKRLVYGYTELEIAVPEIGIVGLHAENLGIGSVWVDGEPTEFEYYPHQHQQLEDDKRWSSVSSPSSAADAGVSVYLSSLEKELVPNLLINCCKPFKTENEQLEQPVAENGDHSSAEPRPVIEPKQVIVAVCAPLLIFLLTLMLELLPRVLFQETCEPVQQNFLINCVDSQFEVIIIN